MQDGSFLTRPECLLDCSSPILCWIFQCHANSLHLCARYCCELNWCSYYINEWMTQKLILILFYIEHWRWRFLNLFYFTFCSYISWSAMLCTETFELSAYLRIMPLVMRALIVFVIWKFKMWNNVNYKLHF